MNVTIVGVRGMLGSDLARRCREAGMSVAGVDLPEIDITDTGCALNRLPEGDWIVNCAAYTDVDGSESHRDLAFAVNATGPGRLAALGAERGVPLLHLSTDYVFDGTKETPYGESDATHPLNVYGESKLAGERAVADVGADYLVVRTQSLFGVHGRNFVRAIMERLADGKPLRVVHDQTSCPTHTVDLADALIALMAAGRRGLVHASAEGACSWHAFAQAIVAQVKPGSTVEPVPSAEFPRAAKRPANSVLGKERYASWTGRAMRPWQEQLSDYLRLVAAERT